MSAVYHLIGLISIHGSLSKNVRHIVRYAGQTPVHSMYYMFTDRATQKNLRCIQPNPLAYISEETSSLIHQYTMIPPLNLASE